MENKMLNKFHVISIVMTTLILVLIPGGILADDDLPKPDGFENGTEQQGIDPLPSIFEMLIYSGSSTAIPTCEGTYQANSIQRTMCLDEETSDLFVILNPLPANSDFPDLGSTQELMDFFSVITAPQNNSSGLSVAVHPLKYISSPSSRLIADGQNAISVAESGDVWTSGALLGDSKPGTPNSPGSGKTTVFTRRIRELICETCGFDRISDYPYCEEAFQSSNKCQTSDGQTGEALVKKFTWYVNQHEIGHSLNLNEGDPSKEYMMTQAVIALRKKGKWTFYIPSKFKQSNIDGFALK